MSGKCIWGTSCGQTARWQISVLLWARGTPASRRTKQNAAKLLWNVTCCDDCRPKMKAADFLLPEGRERILTGFQRAGAAAPDFNTAELDFTEIVGAPIKIEQLIADTKRRGGSITEA